jgi:hypothetical protein
MGVPDIQCAPINAAQSSISGADLALGIVGVIGVVVAGVITTAAALTFAAATPATLAVAAVALSIACLFAINLINKAMDVLFHYKLACIDGERCAIGQVMKIEKNPDGDTTFDMKLAPIQATTTPTEFAASFQGSTLVFSDPGAASRGWAFKPDSGAGFLGGTKLPLFHCEIEGSYLNDWLTALLALLWSLLALAAAALALAITLTAIELIPIIGWVIAVIIAIIALLATLLGINMAGDPGSIGSAELEVPVSEQSPGATGPVLTDTANNKVAVGDFIILSGMHVLDCGHAEDKYDDGSPKGTWCEIHPVRAIGKTSQNWYDAYSAASNNTILDRYCEALNGFIATAKNALAATAQQPLEHPRVG